MMEHEIQNGTEGDPWSEKQPSSSLDLLSSETLSHVVSYCDFQSALHFARATSRSIRQELYQGDHFLWKEIFHRHHFSLPVMQQQQQQQQHEENSAVIAEADYLREIRRRRQLARNLLVPRKSRNGKVPPARSCCFNLPNRCFYFVPVTPDGLFAEWDDPPPVDFGCDSFILTSTACGGEMVSLDPFHGTLAVYESCLDNAVASDEGMMESAMLEAANLIDHSRENPCSLDDEDWPEEHIAGAVFDRSVYRNHNVTTQYKKPPFQLLFRLEEDIDLEACFPPDTNENVLRHPPPEIEVGYHGIDVKCILENDQVVGSMIAVGRMFTKETRANLQRDEQVCTELICWTRRNSHLKIMNGNPRSQQYGGRKLCRFPWSFRSIDLCSIHGRVFVSFDPADGPLATMFDADRSASLSVSTVVVYQMVDYPQSKQKQRLRTSSGTKFQEPEFLIRCQGEVSALAVDPAGDTLLVGTVNGTCEVWSIQSDSNGGPARGKRTAIIHIKSSIAKSFPGACAKDEVPYNDSARLDVEDLARIQRKLLTILNRPKIVSFNHPSHCPLSTCGFVTLQHSSSDGSSLLLWRKNSGDTGSAADAYRIVSMINLPLSGTARAPRVFFDGRRILVFGQDHIGMIILVYHVLSSNEDIHLFQETTMEETSGGVYNLTTPSRVRFANRIRHAALGGLQYYDSIHMTCNDRFIVVNTKTGNLLSDSASPYAEGLLVIDLQD